jgi:hypothetical protein
MLRSVPLTMHCMTLADFQVVQDHTPTSEISSIKIKRGQDRSLSMTEETTSLIKYHTAALDIILKKKTFCIDLGMSSHSSMVQIFYIWSQRSNLRTKTFS